MSNNAQRDQKVADAQHQHDSDTNSDLAIAWSVAEMEHKERSLSLQRRNEWMLREQAFLEREHALRDQAQLNAIHWLTNMFSLMAVARSAATVPTQSHTHAHANVCPHLAAALDPLNLVAVDPHASRAPPQETLADQFLEAGRSTAAGLGASRIGAPLQPLL